MRLPKAVRSRAGRQQGLTLVELMISIAVMAILLAIAVPSFQGAALNGQLRSASNNLFAGAYLARSEAIKRNAVVTLCASSDGTSCSGSGNWEQGWIVACRTNDGATCVTAGASLLVFQREAAAPTGMRITAGGTSQLGFQPTGVGATAATFTVCRYRPLGNQERVVTIDATGRPWVRKTSAGVCS